MSGADALWAKPENVRRLLFAARERAGAAATLWGRLPMAALDAPRRPLPRTPEVPQSFESAYSNYQSIIASVLIRRRLHPRDIQRRRGRRLAVIEALHEIEWRLLKFGRIGGRKMGPSDVGRIVERDHAAVLYGARMYEKRCGIEP
jgi:hypothetical protein